MSFGRTNGFETLKLDLPEPKSFKYGIGVRIGIGYDYILGAPFFTEIYFAKIMLISAFMKNDLNVQDIINNLKIDKVMEKPIRLEILKEEIQKLMNQQQPFQDQLK